MVWLKLDPNTELGRRSITYWISERIEKSVNDKKTNWYSLMLVKQEALPVKIKPIYCFS